MTDLVALALAAMVPIAPVPALLGLAILTALDLPALLAGTFARRRA